MPVQPSYGVTTTGPIFEHRWPDLLDTIIDDSVRAVAERGVDEVGLQLIRVLKNPTGYYESHIRQQSLKGDHIRVVHDDRVIYGPWLEGVGSRNYPVTRFRGYRTFRLVTSNLQKLAPGIVTDVIGRNLWRLS